MGDEQIIKVRRMSGSASVRGADRTWEAYLKGLSTSQGGPLPPFNVSKIKEFWRSVEPVAGGQHPRATVTESGCLSMSWDKGRHHFEFDIEPADTYAWFYMDRQSEERQGAEGIPLGSFTPEVFSFLKKTVPLGTARA
jgi:hypothetical protein